MAPFFGSSFLYSASRRRLRHTEKMAKTPVPDVFSLPSPPRIQSHSLPDLEELRGLSVDFFEELSPLLQSHPLVATKSQVLSAVDAHVSVFTSNESSKTWSMPSGVNGSPAQGSTATTPGLATLVETDTVPSLCLSDSGSEATVRAAKRPEKIRLGVLSVKPSGIAVIQKMKQEIEEVEASFRELERSTRPGNDVILPSAAPLKINCYDHKRLVNELKKKLHTEREVHWDLCSKKQSLSNGYRALQVENQKLKDALASSSEFKLLQKLENEIIDLRRSISHIISTDMDVPALRAANHVLQKGANADNALILALKVAVNNAKNDSPWATINRHELVGHSHEEYLALTHRNAELADEVHLFDNKYRTWKIKAQMNPKYADLLTPSMSSIALLGTLTQEPKLDLECVNSALRGFSAGESFSVRVAVSPVLEACPSRCLRSPSPEITMTVSPTLGTPESPFSPFADAEDDKIRCPELQPAALSPPSPGELSRSSALLDASLVCVDKNSASPIRRYIPGFKLFGGNGLGIAPEGLFAPISDSKSDSSSEHEADSIFSSDSSDSHSVVGLARAIRDVNDVIEELDEKFPESPGLEYIDEYPTDDLCGPVSLDGDASSKGTELQPSLPKPAEDENDKELENDSPSSVLRMASGKSSEPLEDPQGTCHYDVAEYPSDGRRNPVLHDNHTSSSENLLISTPSFEPEYAEDYPADGRRNPVLRDADDTSSEDVPAATSASGQAEQANKPFESGTNTQQQRERSLLSNIVQSASSSITSLKRISSAGSSIKQSISSGLKRLQQISFKSRSKDKPSTERSQPTAPRHRQRASASSKENKPQFKPRNAHGNNAPPTPRQGTPAPAKGVRRPTISSTLKGAGLDGTHPINPTPNRFPKNGKPKRQIGQKRPALPHAPLAEIKAQPNTAQQPAQSARRKVLSKGRQVIQRIGRFVA